MKRSGFRFFHAVVVGAGLILIGSMLGAPDAKANHGNTYDPDTGLKCLTLICDYFVASHDRRCICRKDKNGNMTVGGTRLQCSRKEGSRWVSC